MSMKENLEQIRSEALSAIAADGADLEALRVKYLGKKGELTAVLRGMGQLTPEERPVVGQIANDVRADIEAAMTARKESLAAEALERRLKEEKLAREDLQTLQPGLRRMARLYGLDGDKLDYTALSRAMENHTPEKRPAWQEGAMREHYRRILEQGEALRQRMPEFDVGKALADPAFLRLTAPGVGLSVEDAWFALHRKELQQQTALQISKGIRSGSIRPGENGMTAQGAGVTTFDYRNASREQREALKKAIRTAGARGEHIYPGDWNL